MMNWKSFCVAIGVTTLVKNASAFAPLAEVGSLSAKIGSSRSTVPLCMQRREIVDTIAKAAFGAVVPGLIGIAQKADALDMESFEKSLIEKDTTECNPKLDSKCVPKLTADEALCKYGVPGADARTAACRRVRDAGGQLPSSKAGERNTAGWVNNAIAL